MIIESDQTGGSQDRTTVAFEEVVFLQANF